MFKSRAYVRGCVVVWDDKAPNERHYIFSAGLHEHYHVITETYHPEVAAGELSVVADVYDLEEISHDFGIEVYLLCKQNLGKGNNAVAMVARKALAEQGKSTPASKLAAAVKAVKS